MMPWIVPALVVAFYLVGSLCWGMRGAIICFLLPPAASFLIGVYMIVRGVDRIAWKLTSWLALIEYLIAGSFGGPFLFVVMAWLIGFPSAAVGLWLRGRVESSRTPTEAEATMETRL
jgi:hypothetical protein